MHFQDSLFPGSGARREPQVLSGLHTPSDQDLRPAKLEGSILARASPLPRFLPKGKQPPLHPCSS
jgi:hypothetical protein